MSKFLIPLADYNRIYQVAHGVLQHIATAERACVFFAAFGAYVLNEHYNIPARVVAGALGLCTSDVPEVAFFGKIENRRLLSGSDAFHMWVQTKTHVIDFMAPIFPETFAHQHPQAAVPRKMFQRRMTEDVGGPAALKKVGDFTGYPDPVLTQELVDHFFDRPHNGDLLRVAIAWYGNRRAKQAPTFAMQNDEGRVYELVLPTTVATGAW